jgi:hypothetical protein
MFLESALGLLLVASVALYWHAYTRPERVLERLMRSLDIPTRRAVFRSSATSS